MENLPVSMNISPVVWNNFAAPAGQLSKTHKHFFAYLEEDGTRMPPDEGIPCGKWVKILFLGVSNVDFYM